MSTSLMLRSALCAALTFGLAAPASRGGSPATWKEQIVLKGHSQEVKAVSFAPDGKTIASLDGGGTVKLWDAGGKEIATVRGPRAGVVALAYTPDSKSVAVFGADAVVRLIDPTTGKQRTALRLGLRDVVMSATLSADGKFIATTAGNIYEQRLGGEVQLWDAATGKKKGTLRGHDFGTARLFFTPDTKTLVTWGEIDIPGVGISIPEPQMKLWSLATGRDLSTLAKRQAAAMSPSGKVLALIARDFRDPRRPADTVTVYDIATRQERVVLKGLRGVVTAAAFAPDGKSVACAGDDGMVRLLDTAIGKELAVLKGHKGPVAGLAFAPDGQAIVTGGADKTVRMWSKSGQ